MNYTELDELLEDIFTNRRDVWDLTYRIILRKRKLGSSWLTQYWSLDNLTINQGLPCGVVVCFPSSNFHIVGIEPGISRRGQPSIWNALDKTFIREMDWHPPQTFRSGWRSRCGECARILTTYLAHFLLYDQNEQKYLHSYLVYCCIRVSHSDRAWFDSNRALDSRFETS